MGRGWPVSPPSIPAVKPSGPGSCDGDGLPVRGVGQRSSMPPGVGKMSATAGAGASLSLAGGGAFLAAAGRAEPWAAAVGAGTSSVAAGAETFLVVDGGLTVGRPWSRMLDSYDHLRERFQSAMKEGPVTEGKENN